MPYAPSAALSARHEAIRRVLAAQALEALVVTSLPNVAYLTNFSGTAGIAVVTSDRLLLLVDSRYVTTVRDTAGAAHECPGQHLVLVEGAYDAALATAIREAGLRRVGFEAAHLTVSRHTWLQQTLTAERPHVELVATDQVVERLRVHKDDYEIGVVREAARRLSAVAEEVWAEVGRGRTEQEVALAIDARIRRAGFSKPAFDTIVASGPHAALPHARPSERKLAEGDLVVLDFGGVYHAYCVDLTRTVSIGRASARAREVHQAVRHARDRAIATVAPGRSRFAVDAAARTALADAGMGEAFGHGTGHGLGLEVHEEPRIVQRRPDVAAGDEAIEPGMIFTIEPGAYFPGWGGVRIEDDVLVTDTGADVLTRVTSELLELGG